MGARGRRSAGGGIGDPFDDLRHQGPFRGACGQWRDPRPRRQRTRSRKIFVHGADKDDCCTPFLCFRAAKRRSLRRRKRCATRGRGRSHRGADATRADRHLSDTVRRSWAARPAPFAGAKLHCGRTAVRTRSSLEPLLTSDARPRLQIRNGATRAARRARLGSRSTR